LIENLSYIGGSAMIEVRTKEELKRVKEQKVQEFVVVGELAEKLYKARKISKLSKAAILALAGAVGAGAVATPVTAGASLGVSALVVGATTGVSATVIWAAVAAGGLLLVYALYKDYEVRIEYTQSTNKSNSGNSEIRGYRLVFTRK
jgi:uncharacterized protein with ACT and thioredoxin-like domain